MDFSFHSISFHSPNSFCVDFYSHAIPAHFGFGKNKIDTELDENSDDSVTQHEQNPGVDDGFFVGTHAEPEDTDDNKHNHNHHDHNNHDYNPSFPYAPGYAPGYNPNVVSSAQQRKNLYLWPIRKINSMNALKNNTPLQFHWK